MRNKSRDPARHQSTGWTDVANGIKAYPWNKKGEDTIKRHYFFSQ